MRIWSLAFCEEGHIFNDRGGGWLMARISPCPTHRAWIRIGGKVASVTRGLGHFLFLPGTVSSCAVGASALRTHDSRA